MLIISHAYLEPEHRKTVRTLSELVTLRVLAPRRLPKPRGRSSIVFKAHSLGHVGSDDGFLESHRALYNPLTKQFSQYALMSLSLGMRRHPPDVITVELPPWSPVFWQALLARTLFAPRARLVVHAKKNTYRCYPGLRGWAKRRVADAGLARVDRVIAASEMAADLYCSTFGFARAQVTVLPHIGVDGASFAPTTRAYNRDRPVVGYCGRMDPDKGVDDLVCAVRRCRDSTRLNIQLELLGSGTLTPYLLKEAEENHWIHLYDAVPSDRVHTFFAELDVFVLATRVLPDHEEHDAHALLEALSSGIASIGTRSGIIAEVLSGGAGAVVPAGDTRAMATILGHLLTDSDLRDEYADAGLRKAQQLYLLGPVSRAYTKLYEGLCS